MNDAPTTTKPSEPELWPPIPADLLKGALESNMELSEIKSLASMPYKEDGICVR
jgi:hypothetical protein